MISPEILEADYRAAFLGGEIREAASDIGAGGKRTHGDQQSIRREVFINLFSVFFAIAPGGPVFREYFSRGFPNSYKLRIVCFKFRYYRSDKFRRTGRVHDYKDFGHKIIIN